MDTIVPFKSYSQIPGILKEHGFESSQKIGLELDVMPVAIFRKLQGVFSETEMLDASKSIKKIRMVKSDYEIKTMKKAGQILKSAMEAVPGLIHEGMTEIELAAETEMLSGRGSRLKARRERTGRTPIFPALIVTSSP